MRFADESPTPEMRPDRTDAIRDMLIATLRDEPEAGARRIRRRSVFWGSLGVLAIGGAVTAGAFILGSASVSNSELVHCLSSTTQNADGSYPGSQATIATESGQGRVLDALELCKTMWEQGVLQEEFQPGQPSNPPGNVPPNLQICVMRDGSAAVVPSEEPGVCYTMGLAPLSE